MPEARLKTRYKDEILPALTERFGYSTPMRVPRITKVTVNMGVGDAKQDSKMLDAASEQLATITGQRPNVRRARSELLRGKREAIPDLDAAAGDFRPPERLHQGRDRR